MNPHRDTVVPITAHAPNAAPVGEPLLDVAHLEVSFDSYERGLRRRRVTPVRDMSLEVRAGELVALVGASGAGKSLLGHAVLAMLPPNAASTGTISWRGEPLDASARRALAARHGWPATRAGPRVRWPARRWPRGGWPRTWPAATRTNSRAGWGDGCWRRRR